MKIAMSVIAVALALASPPWSGADPKVLTTTLKDAGGAEVGEVKFADTPNGVLLALELSGLGPGTHALHLHEAGRCDAPDFESAGSHFNPAGAEHGYHRDAGAHIGDLPNIHVPPHGGLKLDLFVSGVRLRDGRHALADGNGAALIVHAGADDYRTEPAGGAGKRIACGVVSSSRGDE